MKLDKRIKYLISFQKNLSSEKKVIFIDESGFNLNNNVNYGYVKRGKLCYFKSLGKGKNLSLISAIFDQEILGSMIFDGSLKSQYFKFFLYELKEKLTKRGNNIDNLVLTYDNCRIHFLKDAEIFEKDFHVLRLPPYKCQMNPIELLYGFMKNQIRFMTFKSQISMIKFMVYLLKSDLKIHIRKFWKHTHSYYMDSLFRKKYLN